MPVKARNLILTKSQAACLIALRHCKDSKSKIAIEAKLDLIKTATALGALARLGLAKQNPAKKWHATARRRTCRYETVPDHPRRNRALPGAGGRRVLALLHRPMRAREIAEKLGVTDQRVRQLVIKLHAQGYVSFGDPVNAFWIVMRAGDKTRLLSRDEERVLSAIPLEYVTDATKIRLAARIPENKVQKILESLIVRRFVEGSEGLRGNKVCRITAAGLKHPPTRSICASAAEGIEIFYTLGEAPDRHRELATPLQTVKGPGPCSVSTRFAAFTAATSVVWSFEFIAFWMMFFEGYIGAPPTVTVCSFICARVGVAATAARTSVATATAVGRVESFMSMLHVLFAASAACACRYAAPSARMQCTDIFRPRGRAVGLTSS